MPWDFLLIFLLLAVLLPWRGVQRLNKFLSLRDLRPRDRVALYVSTIFFQWLLAAAVGWRAWARGLTASELGLGSDDSARIWAAAVVGGVLLGALHWINLRRIGKLTNNARYRAVALTRKILPQSTAEFFPYLALAITAGLCEEFLYRGFAMAALRRAGLPLWGVVLGSAVLFGLAHLYQGRGGLVGTLVLGAVFGAARIAYDSLLPVIVWHAAIDVVAGLAGPRYLLKVSRDPSGASI